MKQRSLVSGGEKEPERVAHVTSRDPEQHPEVVRRW